MNEVLEPRISNCTVCGTPTKPRLVPHKEPRGEIVTEAIWICPRCTHGFRRAIVKTNK